MVCYAYKEVLEMHAWEAIQNTVDYIEENLNQALEIEALAKVAALSPFYYQRLFSRLVKRPVREYIRLRRLACACKPLADKGSRILDIALMYGFQSHEAFTRAFKEAYGITPEQYRANPVTLVSMNKPNLLFNYMMIDEGVPLIVDDIVLEFNRKPLERPLRFVGVSGLIPISGQAPGEETGVDSLALVWDRFHKIKESLPRKPSGKELDVSYGSTQEGYYTFFAGAETEHDAADTSYEIWTMLPREYIVCGFEAENFETLVTNVIYKAWQYSGLWLDKHGLAMDELAASPEIYFDSSPEGTYMELWLAAKHK